MKNADSIKIESRLENVVLVANAISAFCHSIQLDENITYQIETCVVEAVNNAIIHAYQNQPKHIVTIKWQMLNKEIRITIQDCGMMMKRIPADKPVSLEMESGRGWYIMRQWMDDVSYNSKSGNNYLILKRSIDLI